MKAMPDFDEVAARMIQNVEPVLRKYAAQAEVDRRLSQEAINAILDVGLMRTWIPKAYGGLEMDPIPALKMFESIARIDSAAGWIVANSCGISSFSWYPSDANQDAERERCLPDAVANAMRERGLYRLWQPKAFGGLEVDPMTAFRVFE